MIWILLIMAMCILSVSFVSAVDIQLGVNPDPLIFISGNNVSFSCNVTDPDGIDYSRLIVTNGSDFLYDSLVYNFSGTLTVDININHTGTLGFICWANDTLGNNNVNNSFLSVIDPPPLNFSIYDHGMEWMTINTSEIDESTLSGGCCCSGGGLAGCSTCDIYSWASGGFGFGDGVGTDGDRGTYIGDNACNGCTDNFITAIGARAGESSTGSHSTMIGRYSGVRNTGGRLTSSGYLAGGDNTGSDVSVYGYESGYNNIGDRLIGIGRSAGGDNNGSNVIAIGYHAGENNIADDCIFFGYKVGTNNTQNDRLMIDNEYTNTPLIDGDFANDILTIHGDQNTTNNVYINNTLNIVDGVVGIGRLPVSIHNEIVLDVDGYMDIDNGIHISHGQGIGINPYAGGGNSNIYFNVGLMVIAGTTDFKHKNGNFIIKNSGEVGIGTITPTQKLNVIGSANITGNITSENVFLPAYIRSASNSTIPVIFGNSWTNITFSKGAETLKNNIEHTYNDATNYTFTINDAGVYHIDYTVSVMDSSPVPNAHVGFDIAYNTGVRVKGSYSEIDTTKQNGELFQHDGFLTKFNEGDIIMLRFNASDADVSVTSHGTYNPNPSSAQISMHKVAN